MKILSLEEIRASQDRIVGTIYSSEYGAVKILTSDDRKYAVNGIYPNSILCAYNPQSLDHILVIRVKSASNSPISHFDDKNLAVHKKMMISFDQGKDDINASALSNSELNFSILTCDVLGTIYEGQGGEVVMGGDDENFYALSHYRVVKPSGEFLTKIVNYRNDKMIAKSARSLDIPPSRIDDKFSLGVKIGNLRFTSTDRLQKIDGLRDVPYYICPADFLTRKTALLGMSRTGKSNATKVIISSIVSFAARYTGGIGQLILDQSGEYAYANAQDEGEAIYTRYKNQTTRYSLRPRANSGVNELKINCYTQVSLGLSIIQEHLKKGAENGSTDMKNFLSLSLDKPEDGEDRGDIIRHQRLVVCYRTLLYAAGFTTGKLPSSLFQFEVSKEVEEKVARYYGASSKKDAKANASIDEEALPIVEEKTVPSPQQGMTPDEAKEWFKALRRANMEEELKSKSSQKSWVCDSMKAMLNMIAQANDKDGFISGYKHLSPTKIYHTHLTSKDFTSEIYAKLAKGDIVIIDLSTGDVDVKKIMLERLAIHIFDRNMKVLTENSNPPHIIGYVEEAHNYIGHDNDVKDIWPRIAKEGAKANIALMYATQEPTNIHPSILKNTDNFIVTHLSNTAEVKKISEFYDFKDYTDGLLKNTDVGFARIKTLSSKFTSPVQILEFTKFIKENEDF